MGGVAGARPARLPQTAPLHLRVARRCAPPGFRSCRRRPARAAAASQPPAGAQAGRGAGELPKLAVFVSGGGSNFKAIHAAVLDSRVAANVAAVVTDKPGCGASQYAEQHGIPVLQFPGTPAAPGAGSPAALRDRLVGELGVDFVVLAGYLKLVPPEVVAAFPRAMLNIHPGLLPAFGGRGFYGARVHRAVIASGARFTGPTVHFVDECYDTGPILAQRAIPVRPLEDDRQLAARVLAEARRPRAAAWGRGRLPGAGGRQAQSRRSVPAQEHALYPQAVAALVAGRITWRADGIPIMWEAQ